MQVYLNSPQVVKSIDFQAERGLFTINFYLPVYPKF